MSRREPVPNAPKYIVKLGTVGEIAPAVPLIVRSTCVIATLYAAGSGISARSDATGREP